MTAAAWPVITCVTCGTTGPGRRKAGLCKRCYARAWRQARPCASCGRERPHLAAGLCARCYRLSRTRLVLCPGCGQERPVYFGDRCERCKRRAAARSGACRDCGKQVARLWSGRCRSCDAKSREVTGACRDCGDLTGLESGLCKACRLFRWAHPAGTCPWCGREQPIGAAGACRSCQLAARAARAVGRRDFAILVLLVRLGLRAGEVAALRLDDIDWRAGTVVVRGKGGRIDQLPLPFEAGEAVADYLRHGRQASRCRAVFLRNCAPEGAMTGHCVTMVPRSASRRAGLPVVGAHQLRHTVATQMLRQGASLPQVAEVLRHRSEDTTAIYAKVNRAALGLVVRPWPGAQR